MKKEAYRHTTKSKENIQKERHTKKKSSSRNAEEKHREGEIDGRPESERDQK